MWRWLVGLAQSLGSGWHLLLRSASLALRGCPGHLRPSRRQRGREVLLLGLLLLLLLVSGETEEKA
jgi:hypothetical protein